MNDPKKQQIDVEQQRNWLNQHKEETGLSWKQLEARIGRSGSTLSLFAHNKYGAPGELIAEEVFVYRQTLAAKAAAASKAVELPDYYPTVTSLQLISLLTWAKRGRITMAAMGPGMSKSITAKHFESCNSNVYLVTISPATSGIRAMLRAVLYAMGVASPPGDIQSMSMQIKDRASKLQDPLLILDEAQHLTVQSIEEVRHWHDTTGMGIALLGNEQVQQKIDGGSRAAAFAQLFSRVAQSIVRSRPLPDDVDVLLDAWGIMDPAIAREIHRIAQLPGALRGVTFTLELAKMLAISEHAELNVKHVQDAWAQLSRRTVGT